MNASNPVAHHEVEIHGTVVDMLVGGAASPRPMVAFAHPTDRFDESSVDLLAGLVGAQTACIHAHGGEDPVSSLEAMVEHIEGARRALGLGPWIFWGMSGGGWLAQIYARRHPEALVGVVVESACLSFRARLADPACVLSPFFPAWRDGLLAASLLPESGHEADPESETCWESVDGVGQVFRLREGPALLVSPAPVTAAMQAAMPMLMRFDSRAWISSIEVPMLVLAGQEDPIVPLHRARALHEAVPASSFAVVADGGHVPSATGHPEVARAFESFVNRLVEESRTQRP